MKGYVRKKDAVNSFGVMIGYYAQIGQKGAMPVPEAGRSFPG